MGMMPSRHRMNTRANGRQASHEERQVSQQEVLGLVELVVIFSLSLYAFSPFLGRWGVFLFSSDIPGLFASPFLDGLRAA